MHKVSVITSIRIDIPIGMHETLTMLSIILSTVHLHKSAKKWGGVLFPLFLSILMVCTSAVWAKEELLSVEAQSLSELLTSAKKSAPASIVSLNNPIISAEITGQVININIKVGDFVKKGQRIVSLDCRSYQLAKKQALASVHVAKTQLNYSTKQFKRDNRLATQGTISRESFERTEANRLTAAANLDLSKASVESANLAIKRCKIFAPFSGQIIKRFAQKGQLVAPGTALFQLMQNNNFEIKAKLSSIDANKIKDSSQLNFVSNDIKLNTKVRTIIRLIDEDTRTQEVRLSLPNDSTLPAGLSGRIEWVSKEKKLPAEYIVRRQGQLGVLLAEDIVEGIAKAKFYPLASALEGQATEINLPRKSQVITNNRFRVKDGQQIKVTH